MSPRSAEFFEGAKRRLEAARAALKRDPASAISLAYYALLYGARAALSERDAQLEPQLLWQDKPSDGVDGNFHAKNYQRRYERRRD